MTSTTTSADKPLLGEIATFRVYPLASSPLYWTVRVYTNRGYMRKAFHVLNVSDDHNDNFGAAVLPQLRKAFIRGRWKIADHSLGYVLFSQTQLCMETQSHEAVHMALGYLRRTKKLPKLKREANEAEEILAYCVGRCAAQLNRGFHKFKCYRE